MISSVVISTNAGNPSSTEYSNERSHARVHHCLHTIVGKAYIISYTITICKIPMKSWCMKHEIASRSITIFTDASLAYVVPNVRKHEKKNLSPVKQVKILFISTTAFLIGFRKVIVNALARSLRASSSTAQEGDVWYPFELVAAISA